MSMETFLYILSVSCDYNFSIQKLFLKKIYLNTKVACGHNYLNIY